MTPSVRSRARRSGGGNIRRKERLHRATSSSEALVLCLLAPSQEPTSGAGVRRRKVGALRAQLAAGRRRNRHDGCPCPVARPNGVRAAHWRQSASLMDTHIPWGVAGGHGEPAHSGAGAAFEIGNHSGPHRNRFGGRPPGGCFHCASWRGDGRVACGGPRRVAGPGPVQQLGFETTSEPGAEGKETSSQGSGGRCAGGSRGGAHGRRRRCAGGFRGSGAHGRR